MKKTLFKFHVLIIILLLFLFHRNVPYHFGGLKTGFTSGYKLDCHGNELDVSGCYIEYKTCESTSYGISINCSGEL